jgi:hypothetical protein
MDVDPRRLAIIQHLIAVAASVPDPSNPDVQEYLHDVAASNPDELDKDTSQNVGIEKS